MNVKRYNETLMMKMLKEKSWKDTLMKTCRMVKGNILEMKMLGMILNPLLQAPVEVDLSPLQRVDPFTADRDLLRVQLVPPCLYRRVAQTAAVPPPLHTVNIQHPQHAVDPDPDHQYLGGVSLDLQQEVVLVLQPPGIVAQGHIVANQDHLPHREADQERHFHNVADQGHRLHRGVDQDHLRGGAVQVLLGLIEVGQDLSEVALDHHGGEASLVLQLHREAGLVLQLHREVNLDHHAEAGLVLQPRREVNQGHHGKAEAGLVLQPHREVGLVLQPHREADQDHHAEAGLVLQPHGEAGLALQPRREVNQDHHTAAGPVLQLQ